jgi:hypothetical protein
MSNFLAIATVTATLRRALEAALGVDVPGAHVTNVRPDGTATGTPDVGVNIFLYQISPNVAGRNSDLPTRNANGALIQRPRAALDLHYLLTCYGDDTLFEPQRILGSLVRTLHVRPLITHKMIQNTLADPKFAVLASSDLADEVELVKFTPLVLTLEELSKLWFVFFQTAYHLSVAYQGSVIFIEPEEVPQPTLPVLKRNVYVIPFNQPVIDEIASDTGPFKPIVAGSTVIVRGARLRAPSTTVLVGGVEVTPQPQNVSDTQIRLTLPLGLQAGVQAVQVVQSLEIGTPPQPHRGTESNVAPVILVPTITPTNATNAKVTMKASPVVVQGQRLVLFLNERASATPASYTFFDKQPADSNTVQISIKGVKSGEYFIRLQVDGAESPVDLDPSSPTFGPRILIP